jgi:carbonic anhydrase
MSSDSLTYDDLLEHTRAFPTKYFARAQDRMVQLAHAGPRPRVMLVSCADSRVVPEFITNARPGDLFVVRSVANIIPAYGICESSTGAAIEYALRHLAIEHIVVLGHIDCGGVKALDRRADRLQEPALARWLEGARPACLRIEARQLAKVRHRALVEENVRLQLEHAQTYTCVRQALGQDRLQLHSWVYDVATGQVSHIE